MSNAITWLMVATLVVCLLIAVAKGVWSAVAKYRIVIQLVLFSILMLCVVRVFFTRENLKMLHESIDKTGIGERVESTILSSFGGKDRSGSAHEYAKTEPVTNRVACSQGEVCFSSQSDTESGGNEKAAAPALLIKGAAASMAKVAAEDYGKYDKGEKVYSYVLPFNVKVAVSFRGKSYCIVSTSLGRLGMSDRKEVGKIIVKSLSAYKGEEVLKIDSAKVAIDVKYDAESNRTQVLMVVPLDAVIM